MSQDEIIEMARQAGIYHAQDSEYHWDGLTDQKIIERTPDSAKDIAWRNCRTFEILQPFAKLVAEKAIKEALAQPEQEPVAWLHTKIEGVAVPHRPADLDKHPDRWEALYKAPPPCQTCEALARTVMLDQTSHDTTPPQRTWVGLTDEEIETLWQNTSPYYDHQDFARAIEAAHGIKEKNT